MSKQTKRALVPELRFPEFLDAGEWDNEPLEKLYSFKVTNSYSRDQLNYENGSVKNIHYGDIHTKFSTLFNIENELVPFVNSTESLLKIKTECYCVEGDMIFADASEDLDDVGKSIEIIHLNNEKLLSGLHTLLARQKDKKLIIGFGGYLFKSNRIRVQIKKESQGAKVLGISAGRLSNIEVAFPSDKKEQQKIADCLCSLDELITSQTQKLAALKAHKKGLMQQLFPTEGETVPKLRFPEFLNAGEWGKKKIEQVLIEESRPIKMKDKQDYSLVTVKRRYGGVVSRGVFKGESIKVKSQFLLEENDFLISKRQIVHCACGVIPAELEGSIVSNEYSVLRARKNNDIVFFNYFSQQPKVSQSFLECSIGIVIEKMLFKLNDWLNKEFLFPSFAEQQKIADCLSSIDELITTQTQKLAALKAHKKGLMQQLFPAADEVNG